MAESHDAHNFFPTIYVEFQIQSFRVMHNSRIKPYDQFTTDSEPIVVSNGRITSRMHCAINLHACILCSGTQLHFCISRILNPRKKNSSLVTAGSGGRDGHTDVAIPVTSTFHRVLVYLCVCMCTACTPVAAFGPNRTETRSL